MYHKELPDGSEIFIDIEYRRVPPLLAIRKKGKPIFPMGWEYKSKVFSSRGGETICTLKIISKSGDELKLYTSALCSMSDVFCKKTGRELALKRLIDKLSKFNDNNVGEFGVTIRDVYRYLEMKGIRNERN